jgi:hypothetical protein
MMWDFDEVNLKKLQKEIDISFVPPALGRRSEETGISPEQYVLQAFWKGKMYWEIYKASQTLNDKLLLELDFVLKVNTAATRLLTSMESEHGEINFAEAWEKWQPIFKEIMRVEMQKRRMDAGGAEELPEEPAEEAPEKKGAPGSGIAKPSEDSEDVEEKQDEDEEEPPPPRPTPGMSLRDRLKAKKSGVKKK